MRMAMPLSSRSGMFASEPALLVSGLLLPASLVDSSMTTVASFAGSSLQPTVSANSNRHKVRRIRCFLGPDTELPRKNRECG